MKIIKMKKIIKKYGGTLILNFTAEEQKIYNLEEGDKIQITITHVNGKKKGVKGKSRSRTEK